MNARLEALEQRPIPDLAPARQLRIGYRQHPIDTAHPLFEESLVDLRELGIEGRNYYAEAAHNPPYHQRFPGATERLLLRGSVARRLATVDAHLRRNGLKLFVFDAWRPTAVQAYAHDVWMTERVRQRRPGLEGEALTAEVERYWARPATDPLSPSPHLTGGAVDLTLAALASGQCLFMGSIFDDVSELAHTGRYEAFEPASYSDEEARANRRLLYWTMTEAGFANQPFEWWHYSLGDQLWAKLTGAEAGWYGATKFC